MKMNLQNSVILFSAVLLLAAASTERSPIIEIEVAAPALAGDGAEPRSGTNNLLSLDIIDPKTCYKAGDQICVQLNMSSLSQPVTGFQAFLKYDPTILTYDSSQSCYSSNSPAGPISANCPETGPFPSHIQSIAASEVPSAGSGNINLDGSVFFPGGLPTNADALLVTLCFSVNAGNDGAITSFEFRPIGQFASELSFQGSPVPTTLLNSNDFGIDQTPPTIDCPADPLPVCLSDVPPIAMDRAEFEAQGGIIDDTPAYCGGPTAVSVALIDSSSIGDCQSGPVIISRTYRATDVAGNFSDCTQTITVAQDNTPPDVDEVPASLFLECDEDVPPPYADLAEALDAGLEVSDACNLSLSLHQTFDESACPRLIVRIYRVTDECDNFATFKHVIVVDDDTAPDFSGSDSSEVVDANCEATAQFAITVHDNCNLSPSQVDDPVIVTGGAAIFGTPSWTKSPVDSNTVLVEISFPVSELTGCPATVSASVSATDACGNSNSSSSYTVTITDDTPPAINNLTVVGGAVDGLCERLVTFSATVDDNCCIDPADIEVQIFGSGPATFDGSPVIGKVQNGPGQVIITGSILVSQLTGCPATVEVTIDATDCCGNPAAQAQNADGIYDDAPPSITCPADLNIYADAGSCSASDVNVGTPVVEDNCDDSPVVNAVRQGGGLLSDPYPIGVTTITWTAMDDCSNDLSCDQTITVAASNLVVATVQLEGVNLGLSSVDRCIRFIPRDGVNCGNPVDVLVSFTGSPAEGTVTGDDLAIDCGNWTSICAKDEQHTLSDSSPLTTMGSGPVMYVATNALVLRGGDTDNDNDVDINDVTLFLFQFGAVTDPNSTACPWDGTANADFSLDGVVFAEDFQFLSDSWQQSRNCCGPDGWPLVIDGGEAGNSGSSPARPGKDGLARLPGKTSVSVAALAPEIGAVADLNADDVVDVKDVELFEIRWGLEKKLSRAIRATENENAKREARQGKQE